MWQAFKTILAKIFIWPKLKIWLQVQSGPAYTYQLQLTQASGHSHKTHDQGGYNEPLSLSIMDT